MTLSMMTVFAYTDCPYAQCHSCSVAIKTTMTLSIMTLFVLLSVIMLNVTLSIVTSFAYAECHYAQCQSCSVAIRTIMALCIVTS
jgi:hypothetical protein